MGSKKRQSQILINTELVLNEHPKFFLLSIFDKAHSESEDRWITIGKDRNNITIVVVHTFLEVDVEETIIRIISARRATKRENKQYNTR